MSWRGRSEKFHYESHESDPYSPLLVCRGVGDLRNSITSHMRVTLTPLNWCVVADLRNSITNHMRVTLTPLYWCGVAWEIWEIPLRVTWEWPLPPFTGVVWRGISYDTPITSHWIWPYVMTTGESWRGRSEKSHYGSHESDPMSWLLTSNENSIWETMKVLLLSKISAISVYHQ